MGPNSIFYVTDVCIPHMWGTVDTDVNDKLYISVGRRDPFMSYMTSWTDYICVLPPGNYTEASYTIALNDILKTIEPHISASLSATNILNILVNDYYKSFRIYTDYEVMNKQTIAARYY